MRLNPLLLAAALLGVSSFTAYGQDSDDDKTFISRVHLLERLQMLKLQQEVEQLEAKTADKSGGQTETVLDRGQKRSKPHSSTASRTIPVGISGVGGQYFVTFRLANGDERDFGAGEQVPEWGTIKAVRHGEVVDSTGKTHPIEGADGGAE